MRAATARAALLATLVTATGGAAADPIAPTPGPPAPLDPPQRVIIERTGRSDAMRYVHTGVFLGMGTIYFVTEVVVKDSLAAERCRWCDPPGFDATVRDALVWDDPGDAAVLGDVLGFVVQPVALSGLLLGAALEQGTSERRRWYDDMAPVLQAAASVSLFDQGFKFAVGRARPLAHYGEPGREPGLDDNTSFFSGHSSLVFSMAVAAGTVAHRRGYSLEPVIWASGLTIASATAYARIAADKHYLSDVTVGAIVGSGFGYLVPRLFHRDTLYRASGLGPRASARTSLLLLPTRNGAALVGSF